MRTSVSNNLRKINVANKNIKLLMDMIKTLEEKLDAKSVQKRLIRMKIRNVLNIF